MPELPDKKTAFIDWYLAVVDVANLTDKRYGVKGMNVWTPYGFLARRHLDEVLIREIEVTGSSPVEFPALIPANEFAKEKEHIKGFDAQVYWVTKGGLSDLDIPLVLRPTSETAMYPIFALWVRSHRDLPLNVYQIVNTFRYETKTTRPFLRVREIHFFEEHTCQVDEAAADGRVRSNLEAFGRMAKAFALPYVAVRRPDWDKFPGAAYSVAFDIPVGSGRTLQIGSVHHYRENFSGPYGIRYEDADGTQRLVHQTTFGLSERLLGAIVAVHGDAKGAVFPSSVAPYEVVVVPIPSSGAVPAPETAATEIVERLRAHGRRVHIDLGDERPGAKLLPLGASGRARPHRGRSAGGRRPDRNRGRPARTQADGLPRHPRAGGRCLRRGVRPDALRPGARHLPERVPGRPVPGGAEGALARGDPRLVRLGGVRPRGRDGGRRWAPRYPRERPASGTGGARRLHLVRLGQRSPLGPRGASPLGPSA